MHETMAEAMLQLPEDVEEGPVDPLVGRRGSVLAPGEKKSEVTSSGPTCTPAYCVILCLCFTQGTPKPTYCVL